MNFHADAAADLLATAALPTLDGHPNTASIEMAGVHATLALAEAINNASQTLAIAVARLETHRANEHTSAHSGA
ncbi:hypothetical protein ACQPYH_27745 [Kribbella sp. CA-245084]|uniref:hypothetical protein n=1 Tax=Kribbella sp. CA-245084 TaxID=3239940 RepID=UPI003D90F276